MSYDDLDLDIEYSEIDQKRTAWLIKINRLVTRVTLNTFKESGKWYDKIQYTTNISTFETSELIEEAKKKAQQSVDFVIYAELGNMLFYHLVKR